MQETKIRDDKGKFVKGHKLNTIRKNEIREVHPVYPWLDTKGRPLPGKKIPSKRAYQDHLKKAMLEEISAKDIKGVIRELHSMCISADVTDNTRLRAMELFFNRLVGYPVQDVVAETTPKPAQNININFAQLPTEDLRVIEGILEKNQPLLEGDAITQN